MVGNRVAVLTELNPSLLESHSPSGSTNRAFRGFRLVRLSTARSCTAALNCLASLGRPLSAVKCDSLRLGWKCFEAHSAMQAAGANVTGGLVVAKLMMFVVFGA